MAHENKAVDRHYGVGGLMDAILEGLQLAGKDLASLEPKDLAPVDEFHTRGLESTLELANLAQFQDKDHVLDIGCGLGGSVRHISAEYGCTVSGLDLTQEYIDVARQLAERVGFTNKVSFHQGSALEPPFDPESFDVAWTEHVQMNIEKKEEFYQGIASVLKKNGRLVFHDIFQGNGETLHYPVPWAETKAISFLVKQEEAKRIIEKAGFSIGHWQDKSSLSLQWFRNTVEKLKECGPPPLGIHLLMGPNARTKLENIIRNLQEERITIVQGFMVKKK